MPAMLLGAYADLIAVPRRIVERNCFRETRRCELRRRGVSRAARMCRSFARDLDPKPGSTVAVLGNGGFGILHALLLQRRGVDALLFGRRTERLALASELGLKSIDVREAPIRDAILERTGDRGADAAIECTGTVEMWETRRPSCDAAAASRSSPVYLATRASRFSRHGCITMKCSFLRPFTSLRPTCALRTS